MFPSPIVVPTPRPVQDTAAGGDGAPGRLGQPPDIPSGSLKPLRSKAFLTPQPPGPCAPRPARGRRSTCAMRQRGCGGPVHPTRPCSTVRFQRYNRAALIPNLRQTASAGRPLRDSCKAANFSSVGQRRVVPVSLGQAPLRSPRSLLFHFTLSVQISTGARQAVRVRMLAWSPKCDPGDYAWIRTRCTVLSGGVRGRPNVSAGAVQRLADFDDGDTASGSRAVPW